MKLYELDYLIQEVLAAAENGDIEEEAIADTLEALHMERGLKWDNIACLIKAMDAENKAIREEEKVLSDRRQRQERTSDRLRDYLLRSLQQSGERKFKTARCALSLRQSPGTTVIDDMDKLPTDFVRLEPKVDRTAIKQAIKSGAEVPGAHIEYGDTLSIR
jgi:hypothetical protein